MPDIETSNPPIPPFLKKRMRIKCPSRTGPVSIHIPADVIALLLDIRREKQLTIRELANKVRVNHETLYSVLRGRGTKRATFRRIMAYANRMQGQMKRRAEEEKIKQEPELNTNE